MELSNALREAIKQFQELLYARPGEASDDRPYLLSHFATVASTSHKLLDRCLTLEQQLTTKSRAEQLLTNELNRTRAQAARLEGEVSRIRRRMEQLGPGNAAGTGSGQDEGLPKLSEEQRKALLVEAVPAAQKESASAVALQSEVAAKDQAIAELQEQLQAVERDAGMRVANLQDSFLFKLERLKTSHEENTRAKDTLVKQYHEQAQAAEVKQQQLTRELAGVQDELQEIRQQLEEKQQLWQQEVHTLRQQQEQHRERQQEQHREKQQEQLLKHAQGQQQQQPFASTGSQMKEGPHEQRHDREPDEQQHDRGCMHIPGVSRKEPEQQQQHKHETSPGCMLASSSSMPAADVDAAAVIHAMEGQLAQLSGIIRSHETELQQLRSALATACADRHQLQLANAHLLAVARREGDAAAQAKGAAGDRDGVRRSGVKPDSSRKGMMLSSKGASGSGTKQSKPKGTC